MVNSQILKDWINSRPGPFAARSPEIVWRKAWTNFNLHTTGKIDNRMIFQFEINNLKFAVIPLALGGFVLDKIY